MINAKQATFAITLICTLISFENPKPILQAQTQSGTTVSGITIHKELPKTTKSKEVIKIDCDALCKKKELVKLGIIPEIASSLVDNCKALADDPVNCIKIGASIVKNESSGGKNCKKSNKYNCFGLSVKANYKSYNDATIHWVGKFQKWWNKAKSLDYFYSKSGTLPPSRYCTSEHSSNTDIGCPTGLKISQQFYNLIPF